MRVFRIGPSSRHLARVKQLHRENCKTLGFFPFGAFDEYARRGMVLGAEDETGHCLGYILYRISRMAVYIVHLCVDEKVRRKGIAKTLVNYLVKNTIEYKGIGLRCRRDYEAAEAWPHLGFVALHDRPGRSYSGELLTFWWLDHGHPTLFTYGTEQRFDTRIPTVLDACVLYDMNDEPRPETEECHALLADWLLDEAVLCVSQETMNEINRQPDLDKRDRQRSFVQKFDQVGTSVFVMQRLIKKLRPIFPKKLTRSDKSDLRQLAHAIGELVPFFVTRDGSLLNKADQISLKLGISIVSPGEFIGHLDQLVRSIEYQPGRLAGSMVSTGRMRSGELRRFADRFCSYGRGESKKVLKRTLQKGMSRPEVYECRKIHDSRQGTLAIFVLDRSQEKELSIPVFRLSRARLSPTAARYALVDIVRRAAKENRNLLRVTDGYVTPEGVAALSDTAYVHIKEEWIRFTFRLHESAGELCATLESKTTGLKAANGYLRHIAHVLRKAVAESNIKVLATIEQVLFPAKIADAAIPAYIIPIKPIWAMHLFDEGLAHQDLFGAYAPTMLNYENVYYRAKSPGRLKAPGRILWYVSSDQQFSGSKHVRACSSLNEVMIGNPLTLYHQFSRLGIYSRKQVLEITSGNPDKKIMALRFSNTELFQNPIGWEELQRILLQEEGRKSPIRSPVGVSPECFIGIYRRGISQSKGG